MMHEPIEQRLSELPPASAEDALLVAVLRKQKEAVPALSPTALGRIRRSLGQSPVRQGPFAWRGLRAAVATAAALGAVTAMAIVGQRALEAWRERGAAQLVAPPRPIAPPAEVVPAVPQARTVVPPPAIDSVDPGAAAELSKPAPHKHLSIGSVPRLRAADPVAPAPTVLPPSASATGVATAPAAQPALAADPPSNPEAAELKRGLELKRAGDFASAAATFAHYLEVYPNGVFKTEAAIAELDAELSLGHREQALSLLERIGDSPQLPRSAELRLLRAELTARQGRCAEALPVFEGSIQIPVLAERALYGKAGCEQALGNLEASRRDYELYLMQYPAGPFVGEARRALGR